MYSRLFLFFFLTCSKSSSVILRRSVNSTRCSLNRGINCHNCSPFKNSSRSPKLTSSAPAGVVVGLEAAAATGRVVEEDDVIMTSPDGALHVFVIIHIHVHVHVHVCTVYIMDTRCFECLKLLVMSRKLMTLYHTTS